MVYPKLEMLMGEWKQLDFVPYSWTAKCDQEISRDIKIIKAIKAQDFRNIHVYIIIILCMYIYMYIYIIIIIVIIIVIIILTFYDIFIAYVHQGIT